MGGAVQTSITVVGTTIGHPRQPQRYARRKPAVFRTVKGRLSLQIYRFHKQKGLYKQNHLYKPKLYSPIKSFLIQLFFKKVGGVQGRPLQNSRVRGAGQSPANTYVRGAGRSPAKALVSCVIPPMRERDEGVRPPPRRPSARRLGRCVSAYRKSVP